MKIHVLGPGCAKCNQLADSVATAAKELGIDIDLEKVTDFNEILSFGVMMTPGLVIDGQVKCIGRVPTLQELKEMLK